MAFVRVQVMKESNNDFFGMDVRKKSIVFTLVEQVGAPAMSVNFKPRNRTRGRP